MKKALLGIMACLALSGFVLTGCEGIFGASAGTKVTGVRLDWTTLIISAGDEETLTATVEPKDAEDKGVTWESSDPSIAAVTGGVVTGKAEGTATITVKTNDGDKTAQCTVTVTADDNGEEPGTLTSDTETPVTGVTLNPATLTIGVNKEAKLTAAVEPKDAANRGVTWTSSDASVAAVTGGVVTGKAEGTATITVTTNDGNKTAQCTVTVTADDNGEEPGTLTPDTETPVTGVRLDKQNLTVAAGAQEGLIAAVEPKEATNQAVTWTSNNESIATVDDQGVVTGKGVGTATITVKTNDGNKTAQCTVSVIPAGETTQAKITITGISAKYQGNNYYAKAFVFPDGTSLFDMVADSGILAGGSVELVSGSADIDLSEGMEKIPWFPKSGSSYAVFFMIRDDKDTLLYYAGEKKTVSFNNQAAASIAFSQFTDVTETLNEFIEEQKQE